MLLLLPRCCCCCQPSLSYLTWLLIDPSNCCLLIALKGLTLLSSALPNSQCALCSRFLHISNASSILILSMLLPSEIDQQIYCSQAGHTMEQSVCSSLTSNLSSKTFYNLLEKNLLRVKLIKCLSDRNDENEWWKAEHASRGFKRMTLGMTGVQKWQWH